ncbi:kinase-like domain-containing protein [Scleroderma citrinum]
MYLSRLNDILAKTNLESKAHKCNKHLISGSTLLRDDIQHFAATVALSLTGEGLHRISTIQGPEAESLVELLNAVIESLDTRDVLEDWFRRCLLNALIKITKNCGYYPADLALPAGSVIELELKKRGGFGCVYKGSYRNRIVAVKELRQEHSESSAKIQRDFCNEAIVWRYLRHPNCVPFYGVYSDETKMHLVSPWMHHGTLNEYLDKNPNANRMSLILDVIRGLHYLHSLQPHVAHRDLKPENILISNKGRACLADFGLATTFDTQAYLKSATIQYTPQHKREINKRACDIYALGCTIYTVYAGKQPFAGISPSFIPVQVMNGARPNFNGVNIPPAMRSLAEKLWVQPPLERLTSQKALAWMESEAARNGLDTCCPPLEAEWKWEVATGKSKANGLLHLNVD